MRWMLWMLWMRVVAPQIVMAAILWRSGLNSPGPMITSHDGYIRILFFVVRMAEQGIEGPL